MQKTKTLGTLLEEDDMETRCIYCSQSFTSEHQRPPSFSEVNEDILNASPWVRHSNPSAAELTKKLEAVELEILHKERNLLPVYRRVFRQLVARSCASPNDAIQHQNNENSPPYGVLPHSPNSSLCFGREFPVNKILEGLLKAVPGRRSLGDYVLLKGAPSRRSLGDYVSASSIDYLLENPCRFSREIVKFISAFYCKTVTPSKPHVDLSASASYSVSPASMFSPRGSLDSWGPQSQCAAAASPLQYEPLKGNQGPYALMLEIQKMHLDGERFANASHMLDSFSSLIKYLKTIDDPRKMTHSEQLAFWINIHNALVMHAFLVERLHHKHLKSTSSILTAAYDVGGHKVNAYVIQSSILGCQLHRSEPWLQRLLSPAIKFMTVNGKHPYALDHPEPLAHFALCLGAHSDPAVRVYSSKRVYQELKVAKDEFIQANVRVQKGRKIISPKILYYYAKDASLGLPELIEMVYKSMPEIEEKAIQECLQEKLDICIEWLPYKSSFRYLFHKDLTEQEGNC